MRDRVVLALILALGLALRLLYIAQPYADAHGWRQVDTAAIARNFYEGSLDPLHPRVDWGGPNGLVETEFPLVPFVAALLFRLFGYHDWLGRFVIVVSSLALVWAVFRLVLVLDGRKSAATAAAFFVAVSPSAVFFGRTLMPDTPMLLFAVVALWGFAEYGRTGSGRALAMGSAGFGLACLVKIPALVVAVPIAAILLRQRGLQVFRDGRLWLAVVLPLAVTIAWYWHAATLFQRTGLTFGILIHPAKTYPAWISTGPWPSVFSKWSTSQTLTDYYFYERMFARLYHFHLTPVGFTIAVCGAFAWRAWGRIAAAAWLAAMLIFVLAAGEGHRAHDYYQLPFVVIGAIYFGAFAAPAFDREWLASTIGPGLRRAIGWGAIVVVLALVAFYYSGVTQTHFRSGGLDTRLLSAGGSLDAAIEDNALAVVADDYGVTSPLLLYFARLKGWSFDVQDLSPALVDRLKRMGARYFVTTQWPRIERERPEAAAFVGAHPPIELHGAPAGVRAFRLK